MNWRAGPPFLVYVLVVYGVMCATAVVLRVFGSPLRPLIYLSLLAAVLLIGADIAYTHRRQRAAVAVFYAFLASATVVGIEFTALLAVILVRFSGTLSALDHTVAAIAAAFYIAVAGVLITIGTKRAVLRLPQGWKTPLWGKPPPAPPGARVYRLFYGGRR